MDALRAFLDAKLADLTQALVRQHDILDKLQREAAVPRPALFLASVGEAMVTVRDQERTVIEIRKRLAELQGRDG